MLEITFTVDDLARTRLAISPLWDVVASVRVLKNPRPPTIHRRWHRLIRTRLGSAEPGVQLLFDLVQPASWYVPDFLSPGHLPGQVTEQQRMSALAELPSPHHQVLFERCPDPSPPRLDRGSPVRRDPGRQQLESVGGIGVQV